MKNTLQCDCCQKANASVFFTQIVDGKIKKLNLCKECAVTLGFDETTSYDLAENVQGQSSSFSGLNSPFTCPICGFTQTDFKKTGRLGCSNCYTVFESHLLPMLQNMHKGTHHKGKIPARHRLRISRLQELNQLRADLEKAVKEEEYEKAAGIRDRIRSLSDLEHE
ncbi:MAG: UvrB/UvrC motif-containing protein [Chthoniobacterales bacterium]|nr:UvrB/UvrC motif-containing protein [Chthoniobacterales bacterium]